MVNIHSEVYGKGEVMSVEEYNRRARQRWQNAVDKWDSSKGGFPSLAMYLYLDRYGQPRKKGFVFQGKSGSQYARTKRDLLVKVI